MNVDALLRGPSVADENAGALSAAQRVKDGMQAAPAPPTARKAFGNLTNTGAPPGTGLKQAAAGGAPPTARKAFGDITNTVRKAGGGAAPDAKPSAPLPGASVAAVAAAVAAAAAPLAPAPEPAERLAGKGWAQLERERRNADEKAADALVARHAAALARASHSMRARLSPFHAPSLPPARRRWACSFWGACTCRRRRRGGLPAAAYPRSPAARPRSPPFLLATNPDEPPSP